MTKFRSRLKRDGSGKSKGTIELLELRRLLSASIEPDPIAVPLFTATPTYTLADGTSTPQSSTLTPAQLRSAYGINNVKLEGVTGDGSGQTIAIVTAFDDPALVNSTASNFSTSDLHIFDQQFGIADPPSFTKIEQGSGNSGLSTDVGWAEEASLDVEWTHAIAPAAKIVLVEAQGPGATQLLNYGVRTAANLPGVSVVTMSFGFAEFAGETNYDNVFQTPSGHSGVTFVTSTGDAGAPGNYPAFSPNVLAVGGTTLSAPGGSYSYESAYSASGGGVSQFESKPSYQGGVEPGEFSRAIPDVSIDGDPNTGVDVYDSFNGGYSAKWYKIAGTSFSAPAWAGLIAVADQGRAIGKMAPMDGPTQTLPAIYAAPSADFHDITSGFNGFSAGPGYDLVTGRGSPIANLLIPAVAGVPTNSGTGGNSGTASISGTAYVDTNGNGKMDNGETGLSGVEFYIDLNKSGSLISGDPTFTTGSNGAYSFGSLGAVTWRIREVLPSGYKLTNPSYGFFDVTVQNGWKVSGENWGNQKAGSTPPPSYIASISGYVYTDTNGDGKMDDGESPLSGVTMFLDLNKDGKVDNNEPTFVTNSSGYYIFNFNSIGTFRIGEVVPAGKHLTKPLVGYYDIQLQKGWNVGNENWGNLA